MSKEARLGSSSVLARSASSVCMPKHKTRAETTKEPTRYYDLTWLEFSKQVNAAHREFFASRGISKDKISSWV